MRPSSLPLRPALALALAAALAGCASYRPAPRPPAPVVPASPDTTDGPARVGLAATLTIPDNPFADTTAAEEVAVASADQADSAAVAGYDPDQIVVSRYYYDDERTYYYDDEGAAPVDLGWEEDAYYGGYYADYYRYGDPAYYPSLYTYYRPYRTYRPYYSYGWYPTWHRRHWGPSYASCYGYSYRYGPCVGVSIHIGVGYAYNPYYYGSYYDPYFYDPYYGHGGYYAGYYGPGYYGRPRHSRADIVEAYDRRRSRRDASDVDGPTRGLPGTRTSPIVQSMPDPARVPARRGLSPARYPSAPETGVGISRSTDRRALPVRTPTRADTPGRTEGPTRTTIPRAPRRADPARTGTPTRTTPAPARQAEPQPAPRWTPDRTPAPSQTRSPARAPRPTPATPRTERRDPEARPLPTPTAPRRTERRDPPQRETRPAPVPRREESRPAPAPRRESRPAPPPRQESRPAPPPRRESRPAPPPRQESRPAPAPRSESGGSRRSSRRGGNE